MQLLTYVNANIISNSKIYMSKNECNLPPAAATSFPRYLLFLSPGRGKPWERGPFRRCLRACFFLETGDCGKVVSSGNKRCLLSPSPIPKRQYVACYKRKSFEGRKKSCMEGWLFLVKRYAVKLITYVFRVNFKARIK